jgi:DNA-binding MarR family transcriptional regulator
MPTDAASPQNDTQAVLDAIRRIVRALRVSDKAAQREAGVSGAQMFVLRKLSDGLVLSVNELAARTLTHTSSVSVVVAKLAAQGYVTRRPSVRDARRMDVTITSAGRALIDCSPPIIQDRMIEALTAMDGAERHHLARSLSRFIQDAGFASESAEFFFEDDTPTTKGAFRDEQSRG